MKRLVSLAAGILWMLAAESAFASCPKSLPGEIPQGYGLIVICDWADVGPASKLDWNGGKSAQSRTLIKELDRSGTLRSGQREIVIPLVDTGAKLGETLTFYRNGQPVRITSDGRPLAIGVMVGGRGTLALPLSITDGEAAGRWYIGGLYTPSSPPLKYSPPGTTRYTKPGEMKGMAEASDPSTRLSTK